MRGRQVFMDSLVAHGVDRIFGNPGTTESPLINSLPDYPQIDYIVALHEGIAVGAASYYAQASGKTPVVNLHVAPGLGNGLGMAYSALKANSPMVITAGQQDTRMRLREPLLSHDLVGMAAPVTKWSVQVERADEMSALMRRAFKIASDPPCGPVFVSLPIDVMEQETDIAAAAAGKLHRAPAAAAEGVADVVSRLLRAERPIFVAGDDVARSGGAPALVALAERTGATLWQEGLHAQVCYPTDHANARASMPFDAAAIRRVLADADLVMLIGGPFFEEVWFSDGSPFPDGAGVVQIEAAQQRLAFNYPLDVGLVGDIAMTLSQLADGVDAAASEADRQRVQTRNAALQAEKAAMAEAYRQRAQRAWDRDPMSMPRVMAEIQGALPANAVVVEEAITANLDLASTFAFSGPGDYFSGRGGGIGQGVAGAIGVQVAMPDRPVIAISGDGSAMYSIQALWSAAHHKLPIVFVILANREYRVLKHNLDTYRQRFGVADGEAMSNQPYPHMDLGAPHLGFVDMARGMGLDARLIEKPAEVGPAIEQAFAAGKPALLEIVIEGKR